MKAAPAWLIMDAVPSRTKRPEDVTGRVVPGRAALKAVLSLWLAVAGAPTAPVIGRDCVPGRTNPAREGKVE